MMHDGYRQRFSLTHHRILSLTADGDELRGKILDVLGAFYKP